MKKITAKQYKKIQQVAQRFISMLYGEFKNPAEANPNFYFHVGPFSCRIGLRVDNKTWFCVYTNEMCETVNVEI